MSATASSQVLTSVRTIGGLLPADMLIRIAEGRDVSGSRPADYHVVGARSVQDAAERHWDFLKGAWRVLRDKIGETEHDPSGLAVENWLLPLFEEHGFGRLERTPAGIASTDQTATFPVTHRWRHVLVHLAGWDADLDHPAAVPHLDKAVDGMRAAGELARHRAPSIPARAKRITRSTSVSSSAALGGAARAWASSLS